jgi:DNA-binding LacI/PurR family transcriptional regulator
MKLPVPPTVIVAPNDVAAIGAITKLKELKYRVPEDVAVVGYGNIAIAEWYDPTLTTIDQPHYEMGQGRCRRFLSTSRARVPPRKCCG